MEHAFAPSKNESDCSVCHRAEAQCKTGFQMYVAGTSETPQSLLEPYRYLDEQIKVFKLDAARGCMILLSTTGNVYSWGENVTTLGRPPPKTFSEDHSRFAEMRRALQVPLLRGINIVSVTCGDYHVLALQTNMLIWSWGTNSHGQLGRDIPDEDSKRSDLTLRECEYAPEVYKPAAVESIHNIVRVFARGNCSFAVSVEGDTYSWGDNSHNQLGQSSSVRKVEFPTEIEETPWKISTSQESERSYIVQSNAAISSLTRTKMRKLQGENEELRKKITKIADRNSRIQEELDSKLIPYKWQKDPALAEIERLKRDLKSEIDELRDKIEDSKAVEKRINAEIGKHQQLADEFNEHEQQIWRRIEEFKEEDEERLHVEANLLSTNSKKSRQQIEALEAQLKEKMTERAKTERAQKTLTDKKAVFKNMIYVRRKYLISNSLDSAQSGLGTVSTHNVLEKEIKHLMKVFDALQDTSIDRLSKVINATTPLQILEISRKLLRTFKAHVASKKKSGSTSLNQTLNRMWKCLDFNVGLRLLILDYVEGLTGHTEKKLKEFYSKIAAERPKESIKGADIKKVVLGILAKAAIEETNELKEMFLDEKNAERKHLILEKTETSDKPRRCC
jgi:hypothetical protein